MLAIVEQQQKLFGAHVVDEGLENTVPGLLPDAEGRGDGLGDEGWVGESTQLHEPGAGGIPARQMVGSAQGKPGLADAAGSSQRQEPGRLYQPGDLLELPAPPDEARQIARQLGRPVSLINQRRELTSSH